MRADVGAGVQFHIAAQPDAAPQHQVAADQGAGRHDHVVGNAQAVQSGARQQHCSRRHGDTIADPDVRREHGTRAYGSAATNGGVAVQGVAVGQRRVRRDPELADIGALAYPGAVWNGYAAAHDRARAEQHAGAYPDATPEAEAARHPGSGRQCDVRRNGKPLDLRVTREFHAGRNPAAVIDFHAMAKQDIRAHMHVAPQIQVAANAHTAFENGAGHIATGDDRVLQDNNAIGQISRPHHRPIFQGDAAPKTRARRHEYAASDYRAQRQDRARDAQPVDPRAPADAQSARDVKVTGDPVIALKHQFGANAAVLSQAEAATEHRARRQPARMQAKRVDLRAGLHRHACRDCNTGANDGARAQLHAWADQGAPAEHNVAVQQGSRADDSAVAHRTLAHMGAAGHDDVCRQPNAVANERTSAYAGIVANSNSFANQHLGFHRHAAFDHSACRQAYASAQAQHVDACLVGDMYAVRNGHPEADFSIRAQHHLHADRRPAVDDDAAAQHRARRQRDVRQGECLDAGAGSDHDPGRHHDAGRNPGASMQHGAGLDHAVPRQRHAWPQQRIRRNPGAGMHLCHPAGQQIPGRMQGPQVIGRP